MEGTRHTPVLLKEAMEELSPKKGQTIVDATLGGGGYARALLEGVGEQGQVIAFDIDSQAIERIRLSFGKNFPRNLILEKANFSDIREVLEKLSIKKVDAIVADLGFSSDQMDDESRGFSFQSEGPLDMRLDQSSGLSARDLVAGLSERELADIFFSFGEERESRRIARAIVKRRGQKPFSTTRDLAALIEEVYPKKKTLRLSSHRVRASESRTGRLVLRASRIHPATKVFQALRMAVNQEQEHLEKFLEEALPALAPGGRIAVVSFHSGEDRLVKRFFQDAARGCSCPPDFPKCVCGKKPLLRILTKKPIMPGEKELEQNPRSRSAVLRIGEKL